MVSNEETNLRLLEKLRTSIFSLITSITFPLIRSRMGMQFLYHPTAVACSHSYKNASEVRRTSLTCAMQHKILLWLSFKISKFYVTAKTVECVGFMYSLYANQGQTYRYFPELRLSFSHFGNSGEEF